MAEIENKKFTKGGAFITEDARPEEIFTPEDFTEEQRMMADAILTLLTKKFGRTNNVLKHTTTTSHLS